MEGYKLYAEEVKQETIRKLKQAYRILDGVNSRDGNPVDIGTAMGLISCAEINVDCFWHPEYIDPAWVDVDIAPESRKGAENQQTDTDA